MTRPLDRDSVEVWVVSVDACIEAHGEPELLAVLDSGERAECDRARLPHVRRERLVSRAFRRRALSWYADRAAESWVFTANEFDRPVLVPDPGVPPIRFNVSHSGGLVACAIASGRDVGVDVEDVTRRLLDLDGVAGYLAPVERERVVCAPEGERARTFFRYWTLKEAYAKARGMGLSVGFDSFAMDLDAPRPRLEDAPERDEWRFDQWTIGASHILAVAVRAHTNEHLRIGYQRLADLTPPR